MQQNTRYLAQQIMLSLFLEILAWHRSKLNLNGIYETEINSMRST